MADENRSLYLVQFLRWFSGRSDDFLDALECLLSKNKLKIDWCRQMNVFELTVRMWLLLSWVISKNDPAFVAKYHCWPSVEHAITIEILRDKVKLLISDAVFMDVFEMKSCLKMKVMENDDECIFWCYFVLLHLSRIHEMRWFMRVDIERKSFFFSVRSIDVFLLVKSTALF